MLQKKYRLQKKKDFEHVFKRGCYFPTPLWTLKWMKNDFEYSRYGFIVANKISKSAVVRNKIKRRLRNIVKKHHIYHSIDLVFIAKPPILKSSFNDMENTYIHLLKKITPLFEKQS